MATVMIFKFVDDGPKLEVNWGKGEGWWNGSTLLSLAISAVCDKLAESGNGEPASVYNDAIKALGGDPEMQWNYEVNKELLDKAWDLAEKNWKDILAKISNGMKMIANEEYNQGEPDKMAAIDDALLLLAAHFMGLWD